MDETALESTQFEAEFEAGLEALAVSVRAIAQQHQGQSLQLLAILRLLEGLHQEIRDSFFLDSLPDNRQALYALLRDIELSGGWPYIHRMKLQAFLAQFSNQPEIASEVNSDPNSPNCSFEEPSPSE